jgi:hypothetical protein
MERDPNWGGYIGTSGILLIITGFDFSNISE